MNNADGAVICRQLGFSGSDYYVGTVRLTSTNTRAILDQLPPCGDTEKSLGECLFSTFDQKRKRLAIDTCEYQAELKCGGMTTVQI